MTTLAAGRVAVGYLATLVRRQVVIPLCEKHNLQYRVSSNYFYFCANGPLALRVEDRRVRKALVILSVVVESPAFRAAYPLGFHVTPYKPKKTVKK